MTQQWRLFAYREWSSWGWKTHSSWQISRSRVRRWLRTWRHKKKCNYHTLAQNGRRGSHYSCFWRDHLWYYWVWNILHRIQGHWCVILWLIATFNCFICMYYFFTLRHHFSVHTSNQMDESSSYHDKIWHNLEFKTKMGNALRNMRLLNHIIPFLYWRLNHSKRWRLRSNNLLRIEPFSSSHLFYSNIHFCEVPSCLIKIHEC